MIHIQGKKNIRIFFLFSIYFVLIIFFFFFEYMCRLKSGSVDFDLDKFKQEIIMEMKKEINKIKLEIIEGKNRWEFKNSSNFTSFYLLIFISLSPLSNQNGIKSKLLEIQKKKKKF